MMIALGLISLLVDYVMHVTSSGIYGLVAVQSGSLKSVQPAEWSFRRTPIGRIARWNAISRPIALRMLDRSTETTLKKLGC